MSCVVYFRGVVKFLLIILIWIQLSDTEVLTRDSSNSTLDLTERFQVFDSKSRSFRKMQESEKSKSIIFKILKSEAAGSNLLLHSVGRNTLFMNRNPIVVFHDHLILDLDSLTESLQLNEFTFTIYNSAGLVKILMKATIDTQQPGSFSTQTTITERGKNAFTDFFVLAGFILLVFISVLVNRFPKDSADYSAIVNSLSFKNREETLITTRPMSRNNLLFIALNSLIIAFVLISFRILTPTNIQLTISIGSSAMIYWDWFKFSLIVFALIILKYILISAFNRLYGLGEFRYIQFYNSLRFSLAVSLLAFTSLSIVFLSIRLPNLVIYNIMINIIVIMLLIRLGIMFFKLMNYSNHKTFHLFSYLCATELIPFLVLYKMVLG